MDKNVKGAIAMFNDNVVTSKSNHNKKNNDIQKKSIEIVSALENAIESIDKHAIAKDIKIAFDTNIDECYMDMDYELINNRVPEMLHEFIESSQYGNSIYVTLFASEAKTKLNINTENIGFDLKNISRPIEIEFSDI